jgi:RHS repeat-associated protein
MDLYGYDAANHRVWHRNWLSDAFYFYGVDGKRIGTYYWDGTDAQLSLDTNNGPDIYFRGRLQATYAAQDQVGSVGGGGSYPYGESYSPPVNNTDTVGFATYVGDATGLDYAWNRYYSSTLGRFLSTDPYVNNRPLTDPQAWNRYAYGGGDPINRNDPTGQYIQEIDTLDYSCWGTYDDWSCDDGEWTTSYVFTNSAPGPGQESGGRRRKRTKWDTAYDRLSAAQDALSTRTSFSPDCAGDLTALGLSPSDVAGTAAGLDIENGTTSTLPVSALFGSATAAGRAYQAQQDSKYGPGQTIANDFAHLPGTTADTVLGGNTVFINPARIGGGLINNEALLFHEALHALGLIDTDIQSELGITVDPNNTKNITDKLKKDCFNGKGNF